MKKKKVEQPKEAKKSLIYLGPTIKSLPLKRYTVFSGGEISLELSEKIELSPEIGKLIFPVEDAAEIDSKIEKGSGVEHDLFVKIQSKEA